jgi:uncharacterized protein YgiM (DUF1202 family)
MRYHGGKHIEGVKMNRATRGRKLLRAMFAATSLAVAGVCLAQVANEVWIKQKIQIRDGKSGFSNVVAEVNKGDKVTVLERDGKWLKVQAGDKQGYVFENAISQTKVGSGQGLADAMAGGESTSGMDTTAAHKGLDEKAEKYAQSKNIDPKIVDQMIARNTSISDADRVAFMKAGKVGSERGK